MLNVQMSVERVISSLAAAMRRESSRVEREGRRVSLLSGGCKVIGEVKDAGLGSAVGDRVDMGRREADRKAGMDLVVV